MFCAVIFMLAYVITATYIPFPRLHLPNVIDRVVFTLRWLMVSLLAIYAGVIAVGNKRFATATINPLDPSGKQFTELRQHRGVAWDFEDVRTRIKFREVWGHAPPENFEI